MATKKRRTARKTINVPETQRHTVRVVLRASRPLAKRIRTLAIERGTTIARLFSDALDALEKKKGAR